MKKKWRIGLVCAWFLLFPHVPAAEATDPQEVRQAAIVIDDFGNNMKGTEEMMNLPFQITVAVMPFLPTTKRDAEWAHRMGHDVLIHLPMEPLRVRKRWMGPGAIMTDLSDEEIRKRVNAAIDEVPYAIGINNHMGSKATVDERTMRIVLEVCRNRGLLFVDSHTNYRSVVSKIAKEVGVVCIENHIFLDDVKNKKHIWKQLKLLEQHLDDHEKCVAIGHVGGGGKATAAVLKEMHDKDQDIRFIGISKFSDDLIIR